MLGWLDKKITIGDILTVLSVLIAAAGLITAWRTEIKSRDRSEVDGVRKAVAVVVAKVERSAEISDWIFDDIQPDVVAATIIASEKTLIKGDSYNPLDGERKIRELHLRAARDYLYKQIADAHQRNRKRKLDEQIETSYIGLYSYIPQARTYFQSAEAALRVIDGEMLSSLQANAEIQIVNFSGDVSNTAHLGNCLRWAIDDARSIFAQRSNAIVADVVGALSPILSAEDDFILRRLRQRETFGLDRPITNTGTLTRDAKPKLGGCADIRR